MESSTKAYLSGIGTHGRTAAARTSSYSRPTEPASPWTSWPEWTATHPPIPFGGPEEYTFTPDGGALVFTVRLAGEEEPWSTDFDLYIGPADGSHSPQLLTTENRAWDTAAGVLSGRRHLGLPGHGTARVRGRPVSHSSPGLAPRGDPGSHPGLGPVGGLHDLFPHGEIAPGYSPEPRKHIPLLHRCGVRGCDRAHP